MKTEDVLREAESKLREKARYFNDDQLPTYVLALPDVMEVLRTVLGDRPSPALAESIRTHDLATGEGQAMFSEPRPDPDVRDGDWRCLCGDLNREHEACCFRCGGGNPAEPMPDEPFFTDQQERSLARCEAFDRSSEPRPENPR